MRHAEPYSIAKTVSLSRGQSIHQVSNVRVPIIKKTGLLPKQRHFVAAGARALRKYKQVIIVTEIGTGKAAMAASILII